MNKRKLEMLEENKWIGLNDYNKMKNLLKHLEIEVKKVKNKIKKGLTN